MQELVKGNPSPVTNSEWQFGQATEGNSKPDVTIDSEASGEPNPGTGQKMTPSLKPPSHHRKLNIPVANMEHGANINRTGVHDVETKEYEQKCVKLGGS